MLDENRFRPESARTLPTQSRATLRIRSLQPVFRPSCLRACPKSGWSAGFHKLGEHDLAGSDVNGGFGMLGLSFIILSQPAVTTQPGESTLDQPAFGQNFETGSDAFDNFDLQPALQDEPLEPSPGVGRSIRRPRRPCAPSQSSARQVQELGAVTILQGGAMDHEGENQSQSVDQEVSFSFVDLLASIIAAFSGLCAWSRGPCGQIIFRPIK